jgi:predicted cupin superfamily sugar epimerase
MLTVDQIIQLLNLKPLPEEGGYYRETYRPAGSKATAIYYLLAPDAFSAMHRLPADEIYHFYLGDPVEILLLSPDKSGRIITLGSDIANGMVLQFVVPAGTWHGSRLHDGGKFALMGTTMSPGFEFAMYEAGKRKELAEEYPQFSGKIKALTR